MRLVAAFWIVLAVATNALAMSYTWDELLPAMAYLKPYRISWSEPTDLTAQEELLKKVLLTRQQVDSYIAQVVREENLQAWEMFTSNTTVIIPFASVRFYLAYSPASLVTKPKKSPKVTHARPGEHKRRSLAEMLGAVFSERLGVIERGGMRRWRPPGFDPVAWIFAQPVQKGPRPAREWDWWEILTRIFKITLVVVLMLLAVELLHIVAVAGLRFLGSGRRR